MTVLPEDLDGMSPDTIALLRKHGDLAHIPITRDELRTMDPEEVTRLHKSGELNDLLNPASGEAAAEVEPEPQPEPPLGSADQGARGGGPPRRITSRDQLRGKSAAEIVELRRTGRLDGLMRGEH
jgi:hypothetical protein